MRHVFTHFALDLTVMTAPLTGPATRGRLMALRDFRPDALPGLMRKAWNLARQP